jgi:5-methyltetrahydropteroyltriglutamate--homocysteine methyltransferase
MNRSIERVLTTHVGSLPRPSDLLDAIEAEQQDRPTDKDTRAARLRRAVKEVV